MHALQKDAKPECLLTYSPAPSIQGRNPGSSPPDQSLPRTPGQAPMRRAVCLETFSYLFLGKAASR